MLKIVISCGGGMSSSALSVHMKNEIKEKGWEDRVLVDFIEFPLLMDPDTELAFPVQQERTKRRDYDIALLCPHLMYHAKNVAKSEGVKIPMYIIPSQMYGKMNLEELIEDAEDLLELYKGSEEKLWCFPNEKLLNVKRNTSHRRWIQKHPEK